MTDPNANPNVQTSQSSQTSPHMNLGSVSSYRMGELKDDNWMMWKEKIEMWEKDDQIAWTIILINLKDEQVVHVSRAKTVKEAWDNLKMIHETRIHVTEMMNKHNQLNIMGCEIPDAEFKALLVMSLLKSWESWTVSYLGTHADKGKSQKIAGYTSQELISIIIDESNHRKSHDTQEKGYYAKAEKGGKKRKVEKKDEGPKN
ncbi:uncharacterized protein F5891DRAFT_985292 [Suillus fuscotomentosus]|uniref:Uncharacterized protein n=1 Tax=Suillus fuscotomentosus TaxID=1912939 RepID=A0AAD4HF10_9AGAM|nr:uncharacterized protein F5891DRAFT_985292 [Suillus fuscotomentosus]KAG1894178.1 hypothetical protein F5891DRAFT_985292 [Suillus fuscotomentosus]